MPIWVWMILATGSLLLAIGLAEAAIFGWIKVNLVAWTLVVIGCFVLVILTARAARPSEVKTRDNGHLPPHG